MEIDVFDMIENEIEEKIAGQPRQEPASDQQTHNRTTEGVA